MASEVELRKIKKKYGERFMHMCREFFPTILEQEGALLSILEKKFANNSRTLYEDIHDNELEVNFKDLIYRIFDADNSKNEEKIQEKTPYDLLDEAGYTLYECKTEEDIQKFKKYYAPHEELCTFDGGRLNRCVVFFAVKKDVDEIKRENFPEPRREDEYGTSVMSIQFYKTGMCTVSIKNRYNHTVINPDATYGNDLDRIIPGLEESFDRLLSERNLNINSINVQELDIPNYVVAGDGRYYKYNLEVNGDYFCPGNIVIHKGVATLVGSPEKKILVENFIIDLESKTISQYTTGWLCHRDSFLDDLENIEQVEVIRDKESKNGERIIVIKKPDSKTPVEIRIDRDNQIIGYKNLELKEVGNYFLTKNRRLKYLELPILERIGNDFLFNNEALETLTLNKLKHFGDFALANNRVLHELVLPELCTVKSNFLNHNRRLKRLDLPNLVSAGDYFLHYNGVLSSVNLPKLLKVGDSFLSENISLKDLDLPKLERAGRYFLGSNASLEHLEIPDLLEVGNGFLYDNNRIKSVNFPKLKRAGQDFLYSSYLLEDLQAPLLRTIGDNFLFGSKKLLELDLPSVISIGNSFMGENEQLRKINMPRLAEVGKRFLEANLALEELSLPSLERADADFLRHNRRLKSLDLPSLKKVGDDFLSENTALVSIELPKLYSAGHFFIYGNKGITKVEMPSLDTVSDYFLGSNMQLKSLKLPSLTHAGKNFLSSNVWLRQLELDVLLCVEDNFLFSNKGIKCLILPNLAVIKGSNFMPNNDNIERVNLPKLEGYGRNFLGDKSRKLNHEHLAKLDKRRQIGTYDIGEGKKIVIGLLATKER